MCLQLLKRMGEREGRNGEMGVDEPEIDERQMISRNRARVSKIL